LSRKAVQALEIDGLVLFADLADNSLDFKKLADGLVLADKLASSIAVVHKFVSEGDGVQTFSLPCFTLLDFIRQMRAHFDGGSSEFLAVLEDVGMVPKGTLDLDLDSMMSLLDIYAKFVRLASIIAYFRQTRTVKGFATDDKSCMKQSVLKLIAIFEQVSSQTMADLAKLPEKIQQLEGPGWTLPLSTLTDGGKHAGGQTLQILKKICVADVLESLCALTNDVQSKNVAHQKTAEDFEFVNLYSCVQLFLRT
jgi:hypothetical protein